MNFAMWTVLVFICLVSSFDVHAERRSMGEEDSMATSDSKESKLERVEHPPVRLSRKFFENSHTRKLHIANQTGFDGKVEKIRINSNEDHPGVLAHGVTKKNLTNDDHLERMQKEVHGKLASRALRAIEVYGKSKEHLDNNGEIERVPSPVSARYRLRSDVGARVVRSIDAGPKQEVREGPVKDQEDLEDLEAEEGKVFRPLFVYRQQLAKRQHRFKDQGYGYPESHAPWRRTVY
ncbi:uncharacterized protein LOC143147873 [Ptiloglossa arizonensis]|uniref:uncharacterized protein LOC143147873 n=1 Tax=Ptiloglossa arizonensis TaxID=3350558 RepID=UPI003FA02B9C